jgi:hypothetical protein
LRTEPRHLKIKGVEFSFYIDDDSHSLQRTMFKYRVIFNLGRAIAHAVSRWLPTAAVQVRSQVRSCGICGGESGTGEGFLRVLRFPLPILIPPTAP